MNPHALILVIISTFLHAGWNMAARKQRNERIFFRKMLGFIAAAGFVPAVLSELGAGSISQKAWLCVIGSGLFCGSYFFFLARSYESSDFTTAYPVARALPVLLVAIGDSMRGRPPSQAAAAGLVMVAAGCLLAPLESFRQIRLQRYLNRGIFFMLLTAAGTVGYSILDKIASEAVAPGPWTAVRYGYFFHLFTFIAYILYPVRTRTHENRTSPNFKTPAVCGAVSFISYAMILWVFQLTEHASYVVAFRQFSIVLGVAAGLHLFREKGMAVKLTGSLLLASGLVLIAVRG